MASLLSGCVKMFFHTIKIQNCIGSIRFAWKGKLFGHVMSLEFYMRHCYFETIHYLELLISLMTCLLTGTIPLVRSKGNGG